MRRGRFERLVREHARSVSTYARALSSDPWLAEEAVQETFLRAWKYQDSFRGEGSYEGWLLRICRNATIDLAARRTDHLALAETAEPAIDTTDDHPSVFEISDAVSALPVAQREVLTLCGVLGYDYESAAALLDVPVGTIRSRLHRARAALSSTLDQDVA